MMVNPDRFIVLNEYVSDEKRAELFRRASVVVLPYIEASQSFIISIAYRFGKPVVATTVGGLPQMVDDGKTGFLVPPRDVDALADAIVRLMQNDRACAGCSGRTGCERSTLSVHPKPLDRMTRVVYRRAG